MRYDLNRKWNPWQEWVEHFVGTRMKNKALLVILLLALILRIATIIALGIDKTDFGDAQDYINTAKQICTEHTYPDHGNLPFFRAPLLPIYLAVTTLGNPENIKLIKISFAFVDCLTIILIFLLARLLLKDERIALLAAFLAGIYPVFLYQLTDIRTEPLFMLLATAALFFFLKGLQDTKTPHLLLAGVFVSLASLTRPAALILIPFLAACTLFRPDTTIKKKTGVATLFLLGSFITLTPWAARNYLKYGEVIIVNDAGGYNFWRGSTQEMYELTKIKDPAAFMAAAQNFETEHLNTIVQEVNGSAETPMARSKEWRRRGIQNIKEHPEIYTRYTVKKALNYWRVWLNPQEHGKKKALLSAGIFIPLYLLGFIGLWQYRKKNKWLFTFILLYFLLFWVANIPFQVVIRFRIPITDPLLIVFASRSIASFLPVADQNDAALVE